MMLIRPLVALCALALAAGSAAPTEAQTASTTKAPGAKPGDREMTCEAVVAEREDIQAAVAKRGEEQAKSASRREGLARFAKGAISGSLPGVLGHLSSGSYVGTVAAQAASQGAASALNQPNAAPAQASAPKPTAEQQARLDRLAKIAAYRQCAEA